MAELASLKRFRKPVAFNTQQAGMGVRFGSFYCFTACICRIEPRKSALMAFPASSNVTKREQKTNDLTTNSEHLF